MMLSEKNRTMSKNSDRISSLPDCLLIHILSFLNTKDGDTKEFVRTSVLSKRWEYVWTNLQEIYLREKTCGEYNVNIAEKTRFVNFVGKMLAMCKNLNKLDVDFPYDSSFVSHVNILFYLVIKSKVEDITFNFGSESYINYDPYTPYEVPQMFYSYSSLKNLKLRGFVIAPRRIISWGSLKCLTINGPITNSVMEKVLLGCPVLEVLRLKNCEGLDSMNITSTNLTTLEIFKHKYYSDPGYESVMDISAPYIRVLSIHNYNRNMKFRLRNVQSVVQARLGFDWGCFESEDDLMKELLENLPSIEKLELGRDCIQIVMCMVAKDGMEVDPVELPPLCTRLKCLTLNGNSIPAMRAMLDMSPDLYTLHIRRGQTSLMQPITLESINEDWIGYKDSDDDDF